MHFLYYLYSSFTLAVVVGPILLARRALPLLLIATLVKGLFWSVMIPRGTRRMNRNTSCMLKP